MLWKYVLRCENDMIMIVQYSKKKYIWNNSHLFQMISDIELNALEHKNSHNCRKF